MAESVRSGAVPDPAPCQAVRGTPAALKPCQFGEGQDAGSAGTAKTSGGGRAPLACDPPRHLTNCRAINFPPRSVALTLFPSSLTMPPEATSMLEAMERFTGFGFFSTLAPGFATFRLSLHGDKVSRRGTNAWKGSSLPYRVPPTSTRISGEP
ncbi:predicted protein [Uncinocarpus reesii 1704]|uniref:Uncharacterized protein n=1 Tax=Uncinocarpus reesii (strain UAMH 1704) TaxID=336963 RepID=C4JJB4_UNCRE|nr:uncharacterized protein UREG_01721 [Uncinocarpus reesii 1704]EEP76872.1 predicted protein [Uncinocarpus reesii 1704]